MKRSLPALAILAACCLLSTRGLAADKSCDLCKRLGPECWQQRGIVDASNEPCQPLIVSPEFPGR